MKFWANHNDQPAEVTLNGGLVRESPPKSPFNFRFRNYTNLPYMNVMGIGIIEIIEPLIHQQHYAARNSGTTCRGSPMRRQFWSRRDTGAREEPWPIQVGYSITCLHMLQNVASSENGGIKIIYILNIYIYIWLYICNISCHKLVAINMGTLMSLYPFPCWVTHRKKKLTFQEMHGFANSSKWKWRISWEQRCWMSWKPVVRSWNECWRPSCCLVI